LIYNNSVSVIPASILIVILTLVVAAGNGIFSFQLADGSTLPVILIHGYFEDGRVWNRWEQLLNADNITYTVVTFGPPLFTFSMESYDACGSAADHAIQLNAIVQEMKRMTGKDQVNIVSHSKGGLDARVYLANNLLNDDVANLIMIGTPNAGSPLAFSNDLCAPAVFDIRPGAPATIAARNQHTNYHTIAGDWDLFHLCSFYFANIPGYNILISSGLSNDGIVPIKSVESELYFNNLRHTSDCHQDLLSYEEYQLALPILLKEP
jgi:pimeloyl-ACP methyl ester carboxylesterase